LPCNGINDTVVSMAKEKKAGVAAPAESDPINGLETQALAKGFVTIPHSPNSKRKGKGKRRSLL